MRKNSVSVAWSEGRSVANGWLMIPSGFSAEVMAHQGWDSVTVDLQHGVIDYADAVAMIVAISTTEAVPIVRVPSLDAGIIGKCLDAGAYGIICPGINTKQEAEKLVSACRYPLDGNRSFGPLRATLYAGPDYAQKANETVIPFAMIETREGLENIDEILSVDGLKAIYVGPADLSFALGHEPNLDDLVPEVEKALDRILWASSEMGVVAGIHTGSPAAAARMVQRGFKFVSIGADFGMLSAAASQAVSTFRELTESGHSSPRKSGNAPY